MVLFTLSISAIATAPAEEMSQLLRSTDVHLSFFSSAFAMDLVNSSAEIL